jgi:hypothetical protein
MIFMIWFFISGPFNGKTWVHSLEDYDIITDYAYFLAEPRIAACDQNLLMAIDLEERQLVIIDAAEGNLVKRVGRKGEGPGELMDPDAISWIPETRVFAVFDRANLRISLWSLVGTLVKEISIREKMRSPVFLGATSLAFLRKYGGDQHNQRSIIKWDFGDTTEAVLYERVLPSVRINFSWTPDLVFAAGRDFLAVTYNKEKEIVLLGVMDGQVQDQIHLDLPQVEISESFKNRFIMRTKQEAPELLAMMNPPQYWPYVDRIIIDTEERIWVFAYMPDIHDSAILQVYHRDGKILYQGKINGWVQDIKNDFIYTVNADDEENLFLKKQTLPHF